MSDWDDDFNEYDEDDSDWDSDNDDLDDDHDDEWDDDSDDDNDEWDDDSDDDDDEWDDDSDDDDDEWDDDSDDDDDEWDDDSDDDDDDEWDDDDSDDEVVISVLEKKQEDEESKSREYGIDWNRNGEYDLYDSSIDYEIYKEMQSKGSYGSSGMGNIYSRGDGLLDRRNQLDEGKNKTFKELIFEDLPEGMTLRQAKFRLAFVTIGIILIAITTFLICIMYD